MLFHVRGDAFRIAQEFDVAQLVELVEAHGLNADARLDLGDIGGARRHGGDAGAGERHFGRAGELEIAVGVARRLARRGDIRHMRFTPLVEVMHAIGVVPEDTEIFRGALHRRQAAYRFVGIHGSRGIGVLRHAPDAFHRRVGCRDALHLIHIGPGFRHLHGDHLDAQLFADGEMTIVARGGADPCGFRQGFPSGCAQVSVQHAVAHEVIHDVKAGIAEHAYAFGVVVHDGRHKALRLGNAVHDAVVAAVGAVFGEKIDGRIHTVEHRKAQGQLVGPRFSSRHVQGKPLGAMLGVFRVERFVQRFEFLAA